MQVATPLRVLTLRVGQQATRRLIEIVQTQLLTLSQCRCLVNESVESELFVRAFVAPRRSIEQCATIPTNALRSI